MKIPALFILVDRTWYTVEQPIAPSSDPGWATFVSGINQFVAQPNIGIQAGLQYEPLLVPDPPNAPKPSSDPATYATPAVAMSPSDAGLAAAFSASLAAQPLSTGDSQSSELDPALRAAVSYIQTWHQAHPDAVPCIVVVSRWLGWPRSVVSQDLIRQAKIPLFVISAHGQNDNIVSLANDFNAAPYWVQTASDIVAALQDIATKTAG
jgi:hypothetical protein